MARRKDPVLRTGAVTVEKDGKVYTAGYAVLKGGLVRLETGACTQIGGLGEEGIARQLLRETVDSGKADKMGMGRPKA